MKLLVHMPAESAEWRVALAAALPEADVRVWQPGLADWQADYAALWHAPPEMLREQRALKGIFNLAAGVEALLASRPPAGVPIFRLEDAGMTRQMIEYVSWAVLRYFRRLDTYGAQQARGEWRARRPHAYAEFPIGVMGLGVLGAPVARALAALGFPVLGWSRSAKAIEGVRCYAGEAALGEFLGGTRVLVCMLPHTADTHGMLNRAMLARLQPSAYLINVARGALVVDADLLAALDSGRIAGATLDVFNEEPLPATHAYWRHPSVVVTPHIAAITPVADAAAQVADKIRRLERGEPVSGAVDRARGY